MEKFYVYNLLSLRDYKYYTGFTTNLKNRLQQHARGEVNSTKERRPLKLIHYEYFINKQDAKAREIFLKSGFGRSQLKQALKRTLFSYGLLN
jgi:putative endonuclease